MQRPYLRASRLIALCLFTALSLGACGGGGGGGDFTPEPPTEDPPSGVSGRLSFPGIALGRVAEQEPNDSQAQAYALPPIFAQTSMDVAGVVGTTDEQFGDVDLIDAFRFVCTDDQDIDLSLTFVGVGGAGDVDVAIFETESGAPVASTSGGTQPRQAFFSATATTSYDVVVGIVSGHAAYVVEFVSSDPLNPVVALSAPESHPIPVLPAVPTITDYAEDEPACAHEHLLVRLKDETALARLCEAHDLTRLERLRSGTWRLRYDCDDPAHGRRRAVALAALLSQDDAVLFAEPDWIVHSLGEPTDAEYAKQWNMRAVGAEAAWDITTGEPGVIIGIVDTGIIAHPDLAGRIVPGYDFISDANIAGDGDGRDPDPTDEGDGSLASGFSTWHGTHVAGVVCANQNDGYGTTGIAPGCRVMPLRALGVGGGLVGDVAAAILYGAGLVGTADGPALPAPLPVINLSIGLPIPSAELETACDRARNRGSFLVGATGNTGQSVLYPAKYETVFAVGAVDAKLSAASYSNFGEEVDLVAPGGSLALDLFGRGDPDGITSATRDETRFPHEPGQIAIQGTSEAAPHVSGAAALLRSLSGLLTPNDMGNILRSTALDVGQPGGDLAHGSGLLQVHRAVNAVIAGLGQPRQGPPKLMLPTRSLRFTEFEVTRELPIYNGGAGQLVITGAPALTDDGGEWLNATVSFDDPKPDVATPSVTIDIDRAALPGFGVFSGTVRLASSDGVQGTIRVVVYSGRLARVGQLLQAVAFEDATGIARASAIARPATHYRYWMTGLPSGQYRVRGAEDRDGDLFFCEPFDACSWYGGPLEADALLVPVSAGGAPVEQVDVPIGFP